MTRSQDLRPQGATVAQLRDDIDRGRTGDKIGALDPAAAPLGTDEEAGGAALDPALIAETRVLEAAGRPCSSHQNAATSSLPSEGPAPRSRWGVPTLLGVLVAMILALLLVAVL